MPPLLTGSVPSSFPLRADGVGPPSPGAQTHQAAMEIDPQADDLSINLRLDGPRRPH
jgi:hypothetical protein